MWSSNRTLILSLIYAALQSYKSEQTKQKLTKPSIKTVQRCCEMKNVVHNFHVYIQLSEVIPYGLHVAVQHND